MAITRTPVSCHSFSMFAMIRAIARFVSAKEIGLYHEKKFNLTDHVCMLASLIWSSRILCPILLFFFSSFDSVFVFVAYVYFCNFPPKIGAICFSIDFFFLLILNEILK